MKIIVVGGTGTIGKHISSELKKSHEIIIAGLKSGSVLVDITDEKSILAMYQKIGPIDAVVSCVGNTFWGEFESSTEKDQYLGIQSKLMGQINLVRIGLKFIRPNGSFTLTSGILSDDPVRAAVNASIVNGGLNAFAKAIALETKNGVRVNVVSPGLVEDSYEMYKSYFPGHIPVSFNRVTPAYVKCVEGGMNGEVIRVH